MGSLSVPTMRLKTYKSAEDRSWWKPFSLETVMIEHKDPLAQQLDHFCDIIELKSQPLVTVFDGLQNLLVIDAIERSILEKQLVDVNE